ncbi:hypothetical protein CBS147353_11360 [Aspergillus niger]|nr:hypothetical protein CBS147353_11360 [Aspergillus niger]
MEETIAYDVGSKNNKGCEKRQRRHEEEDGREMRPSGECNLTAFDRCHISLFYAIEIGADAIFTTQGDAADPVNRLYPKHIVFWRDFSHRQEQVWENFDRTPAFTSRPLPTYSEASLRNFERDTVDYSVEKALNALRDDDSFDTTLASKPRVTFYDRANPSETSLENSLEQ